MFDVSKVQDNLTTRNVGRRIVYKSVTGTTMDDAFQGARQGQGHGVAYVTDIMTKGRGSRGRSWDAQSTGNIYVSFIVHLDAEVTKPTSELHMESNLEISASLAVMKVLQELGVKDVKIKWLNDLWVKGHKILGALAEFKGLIHVEHEPKYLYILGVGLDLNTDMRRLSETGGIATSAFCETGKQFSRENVFAAICNHLESCLTMNRAELLDLYVRNSVLRCGDSVRVYFNDTSLPTKVCKFLGVNCNWEIELEDADGRLPAKSFQEVSVRPLPSRCLCVLNGPPFTASSSSLLMKTCYSLADTACYDVRSLTVEALLQGLPQKCALLVIGQFEHPVDQSVKSVVHLYVKEGGACITVGNSCSLFTEAEHLDATTFPIMTSVRMCDPGNQTDEQGASSTLHLLSSITDINLNSAVNESLNNRAVLATFIDSDVNKDPSETASAQFQSTSGRPSALETPDVDPADGINGTDIASATTGQSNKNDRNIVEQNISDGIKNVCVTNSDRPCLSEAASVLSYDFVKGKLCLCLPNIEISYVDVKEHFPYLKKYVGTLEDSVFLRDLLFQKMLESCGL